jgi:hypothetical protein
MCSAQILSLHALHYANFKDYVEKRNFLPQNSLRKSPYSQMEERRRCPVIEEVTTYVEDNMDTEGIDKWTL